MCWLQTDGSSGSGIDLTRRLPTIMAVARRRARPPSQLRGSGGFAPPSRVCLDRGFVYPPMRRRVNVLSRPVDMSRCWCPISTSTHGASTGASATRRSGAFPATSRPTPSSCSCGSASCRRDPLGWRAGRDSTSREACSSRRGVRYDVQPRPAPARAGTPGGAESCLSMASSERTRWSQRVTERSNALDLEPGVFTWDDPRRIAESLKRSAERSPRRKSAPFRSAMSMLTFYINRAGHTLATAQRERLEEAKDELRDLCGRPRRRPPRSPGRRKQVRS